MEITDYAILQGGYKMNCPKCGEEFENATGICPKCGTAVGPDVAEIVDNEAPVDNSNEIDRMFEAVKQRIESGMNDDLDAKVESELESVTLPDNIPTPNKAANSGEMSQEQIKAFMSGQPIEFVPEPEAPKPAEKPKPVLVPPLQQERSEGTNALAEKDLDSIDLFADDSDFALDKPPQSEETADGEETHDDEPLNTAAPIKQSSFGGVLIRIIFTALAVVLAGVLGVVGCLYVINGRFTSGNQGIAVTAATAVEEGLDKDSRLIVYDMYIKSTAADYQCVMFYGVEKGLGEITNTHSRVVIEKLAESSPRVISELSDEYYNMLLNGSEEDRILATVLHSYEITFDKSVEEITAETGTWERIDPNMLNYHLEQLRSQREAEIILEGTETETEETDVSETETK